MTVTPKRSQLLPIPAFSLLSHQRKQTSVSYLALRTSALLKQKQQAGFNGFEPQGFFFNRFPVAAGGSISLLIGVGLTELSKRK